jgi:glycogen synthase
MDQIPQKVSPVKDQEYLSILHCALEGPKCKFTGVGAITSDLPAQINNKKKGSLISANIMPLYPAINLSGKKTNDPNLVEIGKIEHDVLGIKVKTKVLYSEESKTFYCDLQEEVQTLDNKPIEAPTRKYPYHTIFERIKLSIDYVKDAKQIYDTDPEHFSFFFRMHWFCSAVAEFARQSWDKKWTVNGKNIKIKNLHLHSWGMALIASNIRHQKNLNQIKTIFTIHNWNHDLGFSWNYYWEDSPNNYGGGFINHFYDLQHNDSKFPFIMETVQEDSFIGYLKHLYDDQIKYLNGGKVDTTKLFHFDYLDKQVPRKFEKWLPLMLIGILDSDYVTTVSKYLLNKIKNLDAHQSYQIGPILKYYENIGRAHAIPNSINYQEFDPTQSKDLTDTFRIENINDSHVKEKKLQAKKKLQELGYIKDADKPLFVYLGRLEEEKGLWFLKQFANSCRHENRGQLIIMGPYDASNEQEQKKIDTLRQELLLNDNPSPGQPFKTYMRHDGIYGDRTVGLYLTAEFQNQMIPIDQNNPNSEKFQLKKLIRFAADYAIIPSIDESFGLVALESLALGTPVICSSIQGLNDVCTPYEEERKYFDTLRFFMHKFTDDSESVDLRSLPYGDPVKSEKFKAIEWEINQVMNRAFDLYSRKAINHAAIVQHIKNHPLGDWQQDGGSIDQFMDIYNSDSIDLKKNASFEAQIVSHNLMKEINYEGRDVSLKFIKHRCPGQQPSKCLFVVFNSYAPYGHQSMDDPNWNDINAQCFSLDFFKKEKLDVVFVESEGNHWYQTDEIKKVLNQIKDIKEKYGYKKIVTYARIVNDEDDYVNKLNNIFLNFGKTGKTIIPNSISIFDVEKSPNERLKKSFEDLIKECDSKEEYDTFIKNVQDNDCEKFKDYINGNRIIDNLNISFKNDNNTHNTILAYLKKQQTKKDDELAEENRKIKSELDKIKDQLISEKLDENKFITLETSGLDNNCLLYSIFGNKDTKSVSVLEKYDLNEYLKIIKFEGNSFQDLRTHILNSIKKNLDKKFFLVVNESGEFTSIKILLEGVLNNAKMLNPNKYSHISDLDYFIDDLKINGDFLPSEIAPILNAIYTELPPIIVMNPSDDHLSYCPYNYHISNKKPPIFIYHDGQNGAHFSALVKKSD